MQPIEIRLNKWKWYPMLTLFVVVQIWVFYLLFFSEKYDGKILVKVMYVICASAMLYFARYPVKQLIKNESILTLSKSDITIIEKRKPVAYLWSQINNWHIEKDKENSNKYLILETTEGKKSVSISWLEKKPVEIEELIIAYSGRAA